MRFGLTIYKAQGLTLSAATAAAARHSAKELTGGRGVDLGLAAALLEEARPRGLSVDEALRLLAQRCADDEGWRSKWRPRLEREGAPARAPSPRTRAALAFLLARPRPPPATPRDVYVAATRLRVFV